MLVNFDWKNLIQGTNVLITLIYCIMMNTPNYSATATNRNISTILIPTKNICKGVFRTTSSTYDRTFCKKSQHLKAF